MTQNSSAKSPTRCREPYGIVDIGLKLACVLAATYKVAMARKTADLPHLPSLIVRKRSGEALDTKDIEALITAYTRGDVPEYQMSALLMAIFFQGMSPEEITALTLAMRDSGKVVDTSQISGSKVDKHSTGGVGDKVSICLAPIVTACGLKVPMISGRGLGHTGGTLDKLEAIPGFRTDKTFRGFVSQVDRIGCALIGQTEELAPADKRIYALRDVTGTVESVPLITASILSKKLAEGIDGLVLDVKVGSGAFMKTLDDARTLARSIVRVGKLAGIRVSALLTAMDQPLGRTVGNAIETREALEVLHGEGPEDLVEITLALGAEMLILGGVCRSKSAALKLQRKAIEDGEAAALMRKIIKAQKGDPRVVDEPDRLPHTARRHEVKANKSGWVTRIDAMRVGVIAGKMGAGRTHVDASIDPSVGIELAAKVGDKVKKGDVLAWLHCHDVKTASSSGDDLQAAYTISNKATTAPELLLDRIG